jgi:hypothetical protein
MFQMEKLRLADGATLEWGPAEQLKQRTVLGRVENEVKWELRGGGHEGGLGSRHGGLEWFWMVTKTRHRDLEPVVCHHEHHSHPG